MCNFTALVLMRHCRSPWVRPDFTVRYLFHAREHLQTFKLMFYLQTPCLPCQAVALLLVPACAPVYIFASHKANRVLIFQIRKATRPPAHPLIGSRGDAAFGDY